MANAETAISVAPSSVTPLDIATLDAPPEVKARCEELLVKMSGNIEGFDAPPDDWMPPVLKICQPVTQDPALPEGTKFGEFFSKAGAVPRPLRGVVAFVWFSRSYFSESDRCASANVDTRSKSKFDDQSTNVYGDPCAKCWLDAHPREVLQKDNKGNAITKKLCANITNVIFVAEDMSGVYHLQFKGASAGVGRTLVDMARAHGIPWAKLFSLDSEQKKREQGGLYYIFKVTPLNAEVPGWLKTVARSMTPYYKDWRSQEKTRIRQKSDEVSLTIATDTISSEDTAAAAAGKKLAASWDS